MKFSGGGGVALVGLARAAGTERRSTLHNYFDAMTLFASVFFSYFFELFGFETF